MHLHTIVRVKAKNENEAIELVKGLLTNNGEYDRMSTFDWFSEDETKISDEVKTEEDFRRLQKEEEELSRVYLQQAKTKKSDWRGYKLRCAGECLEKDRFWSTERLAYDFAYYDQEETKKGKIFYVDTDRHF